jgi:hypothetical protein
MTFMRLQSNLGNLVVTHLLLNMLLVSGKMLINNRHNGIQDHGLIVVSP